MHREGRLRMARTKGSGGSRWCLDCREFGLCATCALVRMQDERVIRHEAKRIADEAAMRRRKGQSR